MTKTHYLNFVDRADARLNMAGHADDERASTLRAEAQVNATQAVAAAINRLAEAIEGPRRRWPDND